MLKKIEILYPELCSLYGERGNMFYLKQTFPDAHFIETSPGQTPTFVREAVDLVYVGSMSENTQLDLLKTLQPYQQQIIDHIEADRILLATGNALELFGISITQKNQSPTPALGLFPFITCWDYWDRHDSPILAKLTCANKELEITGQKNQFSFCYPAPDHKTVFPDSAFAKVEYGFGRNLDDYQEGYHYKGFFGTHILGPLLIMNPDLLQIICQNWLTQHGISSEYKLPVPQAEILREAASIRRSYFGHKK